MQEPSSTPRLKLLLEHFARIEDDRQPWRVARPLPEVLLLVVCGTIAAGADYLLAVKANQPGLMAEIEQFRADPQITCGRCEDVAKGHGRVEERRLAVSPQADWLFSERRFPGISPARHRRHRHGRDRHP